jgi:hypothetical protein
MAGVGSVGGALHAVFDPRLARGGERATDAAAAREAAYLARLEHDPGAEWTLPLALNPEQCFDASSVSSQATLDTPIPESNKGYRMLRAMGWSGTGGLGVRGQGRAEPVRGLTDGLRLGLGKREEDDAATAAEGVERRELESERQARESEADRDARLRRAAQQAAVRDNTRAVAADYYCALCDKQARPQRERQKQHRAHRTLALTHAAASRLCSVPQPRRDGQPLGQLRPPPPQAAAGAQGTRVCCACLRQPSAWTSLTQHC